MCMYSMSKLNLLINIENSAIEGFVFIVWSFSREDKLVERAKALKVDAGTEAGVDIGPVISKQVDTWFILLTDLLAFNL